MTYSTKHTHAVNYFFFQMKCQNYFPAEKGNCSPKAAQDAVGFYTINMKLILAGH